MDSRLAKQLSSDWLRVQQHLSSLEQQYSSTLDSAPHLSSSFARQIASLCNREALSFLSKRDFSTAFNLLRRAEALSIHSEETHAETLRLLACYYGRIGKPFRALACLDKVFELEEGHQQAKTHVNYCAILSQIGKHTKALAHGLKAVLILQDEVLWKVLRGGKESEEKTEETAVAYYNLAVEYEYLHEVSLTQYEEAGKWYLKAITFATLNLPSTNQYRSHLIQTRETLLGQVAKSIEKREDRRKRREKGLVERTPPGYLADLSRKIERAKGEEGKPGRSKSTELSPERRQSKAEASEVPSP